MGRVNFTEPTQPSGHCATAHRTLLLNSVMACELKVLFIYLILALAAAAGSSSASFNISHLLGPERKRGQPGRDMRHRALRLRDHVLPLRVRQRPGTDPQFRRPLRSQCGRLRRSAHRHQLVPIQRCQGAPQHRRRRARRLQPLLPIRRTERDTYL